MKFQTFSAFEKHLKEEAPAHLSSVYILVSQEREERRLWGRQIFKALELQGTKPSFTRIEAGKGSVRELVSSPSLFGGHCFIYVEEAQIFKKDELERIPLGMQGVTVVLSGSSFKGFEEFYQSGKKEIVALDLSGEKAWEREKRVKEWMGSLAMRAGKSLSVEALSELFECVGADISGLQQELEKLICYVGERPRIQKEDVRTLCPKGQERTGWQIAETLVWEGRGEAQIVDLSFLLSLVGQVRYHLHIAVQIASCLEQGVSSADMGSILSQVRPFMLEKYITKVRGRSSARFKQAIQKLFDVELAAKSSSFAPQLLWDRFVYDPLFTSQSSL